VTVPNEPLVFKELFKNTHGVTLEERDAPWTTEEIRAVDKVLAMLPAAFVSDNINLQSIVRQHLYQGDYEGAPGGGMYQEVAGPDQKQDYIVLYDKAFVDEEGSQNIGVLATTLIHELSHSLDDEKSEPYQEWLKLSGWFMLEDGQWLPSYDLGFVNPYSRGHPKEDFAESFTAYVLQPDKLRIASPQKYMFMEQFFKEQS